MFQFDQEDGTVTDFTGTARRIACGLCTFGQLFMLLRAVVDAWRAKLWISARAILAPHSP